MIHEADSTIGPWFQWTIASWQVNIFKRQRTSYRRASLSAAILLIQEAKEFNLKMWPYYPIFFLKNGSFIFYFPEIKKDKKKQVT